jgi:Uma2 family endonuclease
MPMTRIEACDPRDAEALLQRRKALGLDRHDEVWDGVYVMAPLADDEHQGLVGQLVAILMILIEWPGLGKVRPGVNISDRDEDWTENYRIPDAAVFLEGSSARNRYTHWVGGPDWAAEIRSPGDRSREKLDFYASVSTRELLIVDRDPWVLELYALKRGKMRLVGRSTLKRGKRLKSTILPLTFRLVAGPTRPMIELCRTDADGRWLI